MSKDDWIYVFPIYSKYSIRSQGSGMGWLRNEAGTSDPRKEFLDASHGMSDHLRACAVLSRHGSLF